MGQCCSGEEEESSRLVSKSQPGQSCQYNPGVGRTGGGAVATTPHSARPESTSKNEGEEYEGFCPVGIEQVDRQIRDSMELFSTYKSKSQELKKVLAELINGAEQIESNFSQIFSDMAARLTGERVHFRVERKKKYTLHIDWDESTTATDITVFLRRFNSVNRLCQQIIDKSEPLRSSVYILISQEDEMKRDIMAKLSVGKANPDVWRSFNRNMSQLRRAPGSVESMANHAKEVSELIIRCSTILTS